VWRSNHVKPISLTPGQIREMAAIAQGPTTHSRAGVMQDRESGAVLWQWNAQQSLPMASVTKLMTVLVALETLSPDDVINIPAAALDIPAGYVRMGLQAGQQVQVRTLLYGALLPSGNDAALALAIAAAGDEHTFVARMNARAEEWGMGHTHFANPHGIDAPDHYASARDLAQLAIRALQNPLIAEIVAAPVADVGGFHLVNTNQLLTSYPGAYGVKTGTTDQAGQVLIGAARRSRQGDVLTVVMNSSDRYAETMGLMDFYFAHWIWVDVGLNRNALNRVISPDGASYLLDTPSAPLFLQRWQVAELRPLRAVSFDAAGQPSGVYQVWYGQEKLVELPIEFEKQSTINSQQSTINGQQSTINGQQVTSNVSASQ
jgi:D-alanyl-D-alanine carboxypeptidase